MAIEHINARRRCSWWFEISAAPVSEHLDPGGILFQER